jgi:hypothetical protein
MARLMPSAVAALSEIFRPISADFRPNSGRFQDFWLLRAHCAGSPLMKRSVYDCCSHSPLDLLRGAGRLADSELLQGAAAAELDNN